MAGLQGEGVHGIDGALPTTPADEDLGHHDRNSDHGDAQQVNQDEGPATVLTGHVREFPDVAEPDGRTRRRHDERPA